MSATKANLESLKIHRDPESPPAKRGPVMLYVAIGVVVAALISWLLLRKPALEVHTALARLAGAAGPDHTVLNASGYVTARREATISSKITGKVTEVLVEEGMKVAEGQVLARLDDTNTTASLRLAEAQLESARTALAETAVRQREAERDLKRIAELREKSVVSQQDYDHAEADAQALKAHLDQLQTDVTVASQTVAVWKQQLDDTVLRAPFPGIVTSKNAQPGEMISPISAGGGFTRTGICTIVDMESLEIEIDVNEAYINRVAPGQPVDATLDAYPDWKIPCKVIAIIPTADRQKSTVKVRVGFDHLDPRILPDMSVKVGFRASDESARPATRMVSIPRAALRQDGGRDAVYVVSGSRAERRAVSVSQILEDQAIIASGVAEGDRVVVDAPAGLVDGAAVKESNP
jgi:HlyD family secretion protein